MQIIVCKRMHVLPQPGNRATKPKQCFRAKAGATKTLQQAARIMKLTALLLLGACLNVHAIGFGQKISLSEKEAPIEKVFREIEVQSNFKFLYAAHVIKDAKKVTLTIRNANIEEVLVLVFRNQNFGYRIDQNTVVVKPQKTFDNNNNSIIQVSDPIEVRGVVTDNEGRPLPGANVKVKGSNIGTTTNNEGRFILKNVSENSVLEISFVGHDSKTFIVRAAGFINIALSQKLSLLDETIVIAYGMTSRRFTTGNVGTVKAVDIEKQPVNNPLLALQGRVPGVFIEQTTGLPGSGVKVRIQGINSIASGNDPLYVIDGIPFISQNLTSLNSILGTSGGTFALNSGSGNPLSYINPLDIESIDVLKDADATAIYGSRAANGAILITTKKGKVGQTRVDINMQKGWGKMTRRIDLLNTSQYLEVRREALRNAGLIASAIPTASMPSIYTPDLMIWDTLHFTDWQKELLGGTSQYNDVQLTVSGGSTNIQYLVGAGFHKETLVFPGDFSDRKGSLHFSLNSASNNQKFRFQLSGNYMLDNNKLPSTDLTTTALKLAPNAPYLYNEDGSLNWATILSSNLSVSTWQNPLSYLYQKYNNKTTNLIGNALVRYKITQDIELKCSFGYNSIQTNEIATNPLVSLAPESRINGIRTSSFGDAAINSWIIEPQTDFKKSIGKGNIYILIGTTIQQINSNRRQLTGQGYNSDLVLENINFATSISASSIIASKYKYNAIFSRVNYNWQDKYILNLTARRDGSSRFGSENLFNNFYSIGAAWLFTQERFIQRGMPLISFGKVRASYGTTGNDQIGDYLFLNSYSTTNSTGVVVPYQGISGLRPTGLSNPYLQWEETKKLQAGLDLGFVNNRLLFTMNYVYNRSSNQLLSYALPMVTGFQSITQNFPATVQNTSWEFLLSTENIIGNNFRWSSNVNLTLPKNKLIEFPDLASSSYSNTLIVGEPITLVKTYKLLGVDPTTGAFQFLDKDGNAINSVALTDRINIINPNPKYYGGIQNSLSYKGFELNFFIQFVKQIGRNYQYGDRPGFFAQNPNLGNQPISVLNRWQKAGEVSSIPRFYPTYSGVNLLSYLNATQFSDASWSDASYVRLKNVSLSWQLPDTWIKKAKLQTCQLYFQIQNLLTITSYEGLDPETKSVISLPPLQVSTIGVKVTL